MPKRVELSLQHRRNSWDAEAANRSPRSGGVAKELSRLKELFDSWADPAQGGAERGRLASSLTDSSLVELPDVDQTVQHDYFAIARWLHHPEADEPQIQSPQVVTWDEVKKAYFHFGRVTRPHDHSRPSAYAAGRAKSLLLGSGGRVRSSTRGDYPRILRHNDSILQHIIHEFDTIPVPQKRRFSTTYILGMENPPGEPEEQSSLLPPPDKAEPSSPSELAAYIFAGVSLTLGLLAMSCIGSVASKFAFPDDGLPAVNGMLLGCWIAQSLHVIFVLLSAITFIRQSPEQRAKWKWLLTGKGAGVTAVAGTFSGIGSGCWTLSFGLTSVPQSYLFNAFPPTIIMIFRALSGLPTFRGERLGVLIGIAGAVLCLLGAEAGNAPDPILGDCLAFISSVSNAICVMSGKFAAGEIPTVVYLAGVTLYSALVQFIFSAATLGMGAEGHSGLLSTDDVSGVLGWTSPRWRMLFLAVASAFTIGQWGMFAALQVIPALGVSMVLTAQPIVATIMGVAVLRTEDHWPAPLACIGGFLIVGGSLLVIHSSSQHEITSTDITDSDDEEGSPIIGME
eukprot:TRINITY_DN235_c1_g2_i1.p1 TRINITY_DN235_c1_g2~~TRINITY_DN235_c1_g2_i1.p1  ORF type:complete len:566 (+),score=165.87 TRINITY_DN235_c1_g2_i1:124-1821(+)